MVHETQTQTSARSAVTVEHPEGALDITTQSVDDVVRPEGSHNNQKETKNKKNFKKFFVSLCFLCVCVSRGPESPRENRGFKTPKRSSKIPE
jgi:hypothetical protein